MVGSGPRQPVGAALAEQGPGLDERPHALLQEERVALRPRDQHALERIEAGVGPKQRAEELLGGLRRQGVQPELGVVGAAAPGVLILRPVVHEEQQPGGRQALDQPIEQRLGLGVDPVEVFDDDQQRLHLTLPQQEPLHRVQGAPAALGRIERRPLGVVGRHVEQRQERRQTAFLRPVQRQELPRQLLAHRARAVAVFDGEVALEEIDHRQIGRRLTVRDRAGLEDEPAVDAVRVGDLPDQARLAHAGFPHHRHHLPMAAAGAAQRLAELVQLALAPHEAGQPARRRRVEPRAPGSGPPQLVDLDRLLQPLHRHRPQGVDLDVALHQPQGVAGQQGGPGSGELFHARGQMRRLPHRRVVHVQIAADDAHDHLAGVQPDPDLHIEPLSLAQLLGIAADGVLHAQRGIAGAHGMIFMGERRPKQGHDAVAHDLVDRPLVAVDGLHHPLEHRVEELPGLLGVAVGQQLHRALQIGEQDRDLLALAFQGAFGGQDLLGEMARGVGEWGPRLVYGRGRSWRRGRTGFAGPDQATAVVIDHVGVCVENFVLERLQVVVVQTELQLEGAIGHAASALEHRHCLIEHLLEGHGRPSPTLAMMPGESKVRQGGVSMESAPRVYQEYGGGAGEIARLCRDPGMWVIGKRRPSSQYRERGHRLSASPSAYAPSSRWDVPLSLTFDH